VQISGSSINNAEKRLAGKKMGKRDSDRINVGKFYEVREWAKKLGVTEQQLRTAVNDVGPMVKDVRRVLGK
jgi:hypothetical protein